MKQRIVQASMLALMASWLFLTVLLLATEAGSVSVVQPPAQVESRPVVPPRNPADIFETYMSTDIPPADGFDFPVGDRDGQGSYTDLKTGEVHPGWYISVRFAKWYSYGWHPGEDWNGVGGDDTDLGQPVHAVAHGRVVFAEDCGHPSGGVVMIRHIYYENHEKRRVSSVYRHLDGMRVKVGDAVRRRQILGTIGRDSKKKFLPHLHFEMRTNESLRATYWPSAHKKSRAWLRQNYLEPSAFIRAHRHLFVPHEEDSLVLVDHRTSRFRLYRRGRLATQHTVALGRVHGQKRLRGDDKTPLGMYFVTARERRDVHGPVRRALGGSWLKLNYPNKYDAEWGRAHGLISHEEEAAIARSWQARRGTSPDTKLGRNIGILGTSGDLHDPGRFQVSWGCLVLADRDLERVLDQIPRGAMVVIF